MVSFISVSGMQDLKYAPFASAINPGFWSAFAKLKLEVLGLSESAIKVQAQYDNKALTDLPSSMCVEWDAFDANFKLNWSTYSSIGSVINYNTLEAFKNADKAEYLNSVEGKLLYKAMISNEIFDDPRLLSRFVIHMFSDLKKYHYYYWFAFPAFVLPESLKISETLVPVTVILGEKKVARLSSSYKKWKNDYPKQSGFFWLKTDDGSDAVSILTLEKGLSDNTAILGFADPSSSPDYPGWPLRNLLALIGYAQPDRFSQGIRVLCLRQKAVLGGELTVEPSLIMTIKWTGDPEEIRREFASPLKVTGWEKNEKNQFAPKFANMRSSMDPKSLAESSVDLNLKLMKWRLVPDLDLSLLANTKCLLLGSGTLGCNVARCLLGWGVRNITFVDNGKVSYSNPVRQSLFSFQDCLDGEKCKATAAAEMLQKIFPGVNSASVSLTIPMPGHPISDSILDSVKKDYDNLESLIRNHDVIYLLMDTRESRWLPTLMAAHYGKLVINSALGFDTFLVMRHGVRNERSWEALDISSRVPGHQLGCYFCNDVVAPGNSTKDRSLDQQCTVTRPGVSYNAAGFAVELMASVLQHPLGYAAGASVKANQDSDDHEGTLGSVVHSIRGSVSQFQMTTPTTARFTNCTACSKMVLDQFSQSGFELLLKTAKNPKYLEDITGLAGLMSEANFEDIIECSDDDF